MQKKRRAGWIGDWIRNLTLRCTPIYSAKQWIWYRKHNAGISTVAPLWKDIGFSAVITCLVQGGDCRMLCGHDTQRSHFPCSPKLPEGVSYRTPVSQALRSASDNWTHGPEPRPGPRIWDIYPVKLRLPQKSMDFKKIWKKKPALESARESAARDVKYSAYIGMYSLNNHITPTSTPQKALA